METYSIVGLPSVVTFRILDELLLSAKPLAFPPHRIVHVLALFRDMSQLALVDRQHAQLWLDYVRTRLIPLAVLLMTMPTGDTPNNKCLCWNPLLTWMWTSASLLPATPTRQQRLLFFTRLRLNSRLLGEPFAANSFFFVQHHDMRRSWLDEHDHLAASHALAFQVDGECRRRYTACPLTCNMRLRTFVQCIFAMRRYTVIAHRHPLEEVQRGFDKQFVCRQQIIPGVTLRDDVDEGNGGLLTCLEQARLYRRVLEMSSAQLRVKTHVRRQLWRIAYTEEARVGIHYLLRWLCIHRHPKLDRQNFNHYFTRVPHLVISGDDNPFGLPHTILYRQHCRTIHWQLPRSLSIAVLDQLEKVSVGSGLAAFTKMNWPHQQTTTELVRLLDRCFPPLQQQQKCGLLPPRLVTSTQEICHALGYSFPTVRLPVNPDNPKDVGDFAGILTLNSDLPVFLPTHTSKQQMNYVERMWNDTLGSDAYNGSILVCHPHETNDFVVSKLQRLAKDADWLTCDEHYGPVDVVCYEPPEWLVAMVPLEILTLGSYQERLYALCVVAGMLWNQDKPDRVTGKIAASLGIFLGGLDVDWIGE